MKIVILKEDISVNDFLVQNRIDNLDDIQVGESLGYLIVPDAVAETLRDNPNIESIADDEEVKAFGYSEEDHLEYICNQSVIEAYQGYESHQLNQNDLIQSQIQVPRSNEVELNDVQVKSIEENLKMIESPAAWLYTRGRAARIGVIDTGIDRSHDQLDVVDGYNFIDSTNNWDDDNGHGTHVAGICAAKLDETHTVGVAPEADLYALKVLDRYGSGTYSNVINAIEWCVNNNIHIANLSLGSPAHDHDPQNYHRELETIGNRAFQSGLVLVAAAGNDYGNPVGNPARCPSYIAVSSIDKNYALSNFSSVGPQVELTAPGASIFSSYPPNDFRVLSGTSMACPHVAGVAALIKSRRSSWDSTRIRNKLVDAATDLGSVGRDWSFGFGLVHARRSVR